MYRVLNANTIEAFFQFKTHQNSVFHFKEVTVKVIKKEIQKLQQGLLKKMQLFLRLFV